MAKNGQLVCQYLENIDRDALENFQDIIRLYVRRRHGIYALYRKKKLYYVGLAGNLRTRLTTHLKDRHSNSWDRFSVYLTLEDTHMRELESLLVRVVKPSGNRQVGKFANSENMVKRFLRDVRKSQLQELYQIVGRSPSTRTDVKLTPLKRGRTPVLARYFQRPTELRAKFKGRTVKAKVRRDGLIRFGGKLFTSPSLAAAAACSRPTCNGWQFWLYQRAPGDWIAINQLRK